MMKEVSLPLLESTSVSFAIQVFRPALRILSSCRDDSDEEDMVMASPSKIVNMLVEWMDPNEVMYVQFIGKRNRL